MGGDLFGSARFELAGITAQCRQCGGVQFARAGRSARQRADALVCAKCGAEYRRTELMQQILAEGRARAESVRRRASQLLGHRRSPGLFTRLALARSELAFVETMEDWSLLVEIGRAAEAGKPLSLSALQTLGIASHAIVDRRLRRLRKLGLIVQKPAAKDARVRELVLAPEVQRAFEACAAALRG